MSVVVLSPCQRLLQTMHPHAHAQHNGAQAPMHGSLHPAVPACPYNTHCSTAQAAMLECCKVHD